MAKCYNCNIIINQYENKDKYKNNKKVCYLCDSCSQDESYIDVPYQEIDSVMNFCSKIFLCVEKMFILKNEYNDHCKSKICDDLNKMKISDLRRKKFDEELKEKKNG